MNPKTKQTILSELKTLFATQGKRLNRHMDRFKTERQCTIRKENLDETLARLVQHDWTTIDYLVTHESTTSSVMITVSLNEEMNYGVRIQGVFGGTVEQIQHWSLFLRDVSEFADDIEFIMKKGQE